MRERHKLGLSASDGIAIGYVRKYHSGDNDHLFQNQSTIDEEDISLEIRAYKMATSSYVEFLEENLQEDSRGDIISVHKEIIEDPYIHEEIISKIKLDKLCAIKSINKVYSQLIDEISQVEDDYLQARVDHFQDIKKQLINTLIGGTRQELTSLEEDTIVVAKDLLPSDTINIDEKNIKGFLTDLGGIGSHVSIIAQTMGIPAIVSMGDIYESVRDNELVIIDTYNSKVILDPDEDQLDFYLDKIGGLAREEEKLIAKTQEPSITTDGRELRVFSNIGNCKELESSIYYGLNGVGLFRTEYLYMNSKGFPTEDEQYLEYRKAIEYLAGKELTIRTLDIGGDKSLPYFNFPKEENPFLGWRALRISFDMPDVFKRQLKAILRASAHGPVSILLPMVINLEEIHKFYDILEVCKFELDRQKISYDPNIKVGIMIETPSSVIMAEVFAGLVDFFSIGTNDLTQYMLAVDRGNVNIGNLYSNYNPAVLRTVKHVIDVAHASGIYSAMCGGMASDFKATKLLLGLGLDEISVVGRRIPRIKDQIRRISFHQSKAFADHVLELNTTEEVMEAVNKDYEDLYK